ncbi:hypothetical protein [Helicobacter sp. 11S03491-1]|uniref:hypothetical protein n=1 Tax=Helicobacter sp. 11S03491-1 TaxID=1476196 RepID=UPI000BA69F74|nr:hypothetical protein [Helicobacter sp. 11S03491-1]PAF42224.1 hypothetical protein BKH45_04575 [Helicobacter sp. 11S03491-1]
MNNINIYDIKMIKMYLQNHGYTQDELKHLDNKKIFALYKDESIKGIYEFEGILNQDTSSAIENFKNYNVDEQLKDKIQKDSRDISKIYDLINEYIDEYTYDEFLEIFKTQFSNIAMNKIEKILRIKYRQFQEIWLEKLELRFQHLPVEERIPLMKYYEKNRDNIQKLKYVYHHSENPTYIHDIQRVSEIKLNIIKTFMPELMEENYKDYYDETPEKIALVDEVLKLTSSYSKQYLKDLNIAKLKFLQNEVIEQNKKDIHDKKVFQKYTKALEDSINTMDDDEFGKICLNAITELNSDQIQKIINYLSNKNKLFLNKFNTTIKGYQNIIKVKFI